MTKPIPLTCLGNAIVDVLATADDQFLINNGIIKAAMNLIDEPRAHALYDKMGTAHQVSGGSAANTAAGFASFGGRVSYLGKVAADQLGDAFAHDMKASGVDFPCTRLHNGPSTARSLIFVTPDSQRSMNTYLGACVEFSENDIHEETIQNSAYIYLEGYLFDRPQAKAAYRKATRLAHAHGGKVALTLSDTFCVHRHRCDFIELVKNDTDVLFANELEIKALFDADGLNEAIAKVRALCPLTVITRSEHGSIIVTPEEDIAIKAHPVHKVIDTTGAGDQYAAGFLFGLTHGYPLPVCGKLGSLAASEAIAHFGPRPETSLKELAERELGLTLKAA